MRHKHVLIEDGGGGAEGDPILWPRRRCYLGRFAAAAASREAIRESVIMLGGVAGEGQSISTGPPPNIMRFSDGLPKRA